MKIHHSWNWYTLRFDVETVSNLWRPLRRVSSSLPLMAALTLLVFKLWQKQFSPKATKLHPYHHIKFVNERINDTSVNYDTSLNYEFRGTWFLPKYKILVGQAYRTGLFYSSPTLNVRIKVFTKLYNSSFKIQNFPASEGANPPDTHLCIHLTLTRHQIKKKMLKDGSMPLYSTVLE